MQLGCVNNQQPPLYSQLRRPSQPRSSDAQGGCRAIVRGPPRPSHPSSVSPFLSGAWSGGRACPWCASCIQKLRSCRMVPERLDPEGGRNSGCKRQTHSSIISSPPRFCVSLEIVSRVTCPEGALLVGIWAPFPIVCCRVSGAYQGFSSWMLFLLARPPPLVHF